jgi:putative membrane protein
MKTNRLVLTVLFAGLIVGVTACQRHKGVEAAREGTVATLTPSERDIASKIEQTHLGAVAMARMAKDHSANKDVKDYAETLIKDHNKALNDIENLLKEQKATPSAAATLPAGMQEQMNKLQKMSGTDFDREFMGMMVQNGQKTLSTLNQSLTTVQNTALKDYIKDLMPTVQKHLDRAMEIQKKLTTATK